MAKETAKELDHRLLRQVQDGDMVAFSELVNRYRDRLMNVIGRMRISRECAEDIIQEAFLRVYQHRDKFDFKHCFSTWLYTIALNLARNELRRNKKYTFVDIFDMQNKEVEASVDAKVPSNLGPILQKAIDTLPEKYKTAFLLRDIEEMPYDEVARVLSVPLGTVKSRVNRARSILRDKLKPRMEERNALSKGALLPVNFF
ncbi:MAG: sigma-70 family RNA polymerase sigma factor [candidate division Zixibacteria bacterium]|nr:sigma-70 family RNA polymerase sigma factor [candidate division Zixibacteria bacterium]